MKKTAALILLVSFLINPANVWAAKKTMTGYIYDSDISVLATDTEPTPSQPAYYAIYSAGSGEMSVPSYANIQGSIYSGGAITVGGSTITITGSIIAKSVTFASYITVDGDVCASVGDVLMPYVSNVTIKGKIDTPGNVSLAASCVVKKDIFAGGNVTMTSEGATVEGDIHAGGDVSIQGKCYAKKNVRAGGSLTMGNENSSVTKDVHTGGNVNLQSKTYIYGSVWAGGTIPSYSGNISGVAETGERASVPPRLLPLAPTACPNVPAPKASIPTDSNNFPAGLKEVDMKTYGSQSIEPNKYTDVIFGNNTTLTMSAGNCNKFGDTGCYYFSSIQGGVNGQAIYMDFTGSQTSQIIVFVNGNITHSGPVYVKSDDIDEWKRIDEVDTTTARALAKRVYWETNGTFSTNYNANIVQWLGTVLAQNIKLNYNEWIIGSLATMAGGTITSSSQFTVDYVVADYARAHW